LIPLLFLMIENDGDRAFMEQVYEQYHRLMYAQALRVLRQSEAAEDAVSDSLMALMKKISLLRTFDCNKLRSYLVITVKHTAITQLNRKKRERLSSDVTLEDLADTARTDARLMEQAGVERIKEAISKLPGREREIMLMRYFREMTDEEIAGETGLRPVSVRVHLSRARKTLSRLLSGKEEDTP